MRVLFFAFSVVVEPSTEGSENLFSSFFAPKQHKQTNLHACSAYRVGLYRAGGAQHIVRRRGFRSAAVVRLQRTSLRHLMGWGGLGLSAHPSFRRLGPYTVHVRLILPLNSCKPADIEKADPGLSFGGRAPKHPAQGSGTTTAPRGWLPKSFQGELSFSATEPFDAKAGEAMQSRLKLFNNKKSIQQRRCV